MVSIVAPQYTWLNHETVSFQCHTVAQLHPILKMTEKPFARTDKAEFYRLPGGCVLKRYFTENAVDRVIHDQFSLRYIYQNFGEMHYQGWLYRIVKFLCVASDRKAFLMEYVPGLVLSATSRSRMKEAEYHCGIWMALYHNKVLKRSGEGLIFTDLNVHNIILDFDKKCVTAIDPGMTWGRTGLIYEDLIKHINSTLLVLIVWRKAPFFAIMEFLRGYAATINVKLNLFAYYKGLFRELRRQFKDHAARSYLKSVLFVVAAGAFSFLYLFVIPGYLVAKKQ